MAIVRSSGRRHSSDHCWSVFFEVDLGRVSQSELTSQLCRSKIFSLKLLYEYTDTHRVYCCTWTTKVLGDHSLVSGELVFIDAPRNNYAFEC